MDPARTTSHELEDGRGKKFSVLPDELHFAAAVFRLVHRECDATYARRKWDTAWLRCRVVPGITCIR